MSSPAAALALSVESSKTASNAGVINTSVVDLGLVGWLVGWLQNWGCVNCG